jgi:hypothetical protein
MKSEWQHQKGAITTDKKNLTDDEHIHEQDKQHLRASDKKKNHIPGQGEKKGGDKTSYQED